MNFYYPSTQTITSPPYNLDQNLYHPVMERIAVWKPTFVGDLSTFWGHDSHRTQNIPVNGIGVTPRWLSNTRPTRLRNGSGWGPVISICRMGSRVKGSEGFQTNSHLRAGFFKEEP